MHLTIKRIPALAATAGIALAGSALAAPVAAHAATSPSTPKTVLTANAQNHKQVKKLLGNTSYTPLIRTFTPKPTSSKGFNGYERIVVKSPKGTGPVVGSFALKGAQAGSVVVTSAGVVQSQNAYVVNLKFPGEQGKTGKLQITLVSR
jgi:hypothetical protein